jgi:hypothetical protein
MEQTLTKRGRPRKAPELLVANGVLIQPRFPRITHREMQSAAAAEGLTVTGWVRRLVCVALAARKRKAS